jgi:peptide/nickel transport system permease protein
VASGRGGSARLLYGGRNSLFIAGLATILTLVRAGIVGLTAGFFGGIVDWMLSRLLDVLWAFPVYLLAISLPIGAAAGRRVRRLASGRGVRRPRHQRCQRS